MGGPISEVQLHQGNADTTAWGWTEKRQYIAVTAYMMQFSASFVDFKPNRYGKLPLNPSATSLPGWYFTAVVLQPTSSPKEDGHMTLFASYARELLEQPIICVLYARL
jgi:hypothetical protein